MPQLWDLHILSTSRAVLLNVLSSADGPLLPLKYISAILTKAELLSLDSFSGLDGRVSAQ